MARRPAPARFAERLALVVGGLLAGLALIEMGLRLLAVAAPHVLARSRPRTTDAHLHVLCTGDSHTYGVMVPPGRAYPEQVERRLQARGVDAVVYNFGLPGQSTRQVLDRLPSQIDVYRPDVLLVWAGVNNYWNLKGRADDPDARRVHVGWNELLLVRFGHLLRMGLLNEEAFGRRRPDAQPHGGGVVDPHRWRVGGAGFEEVIEMPIVRGNLDAAAVERVTEDDVRGIVALARARNVKVAFLSYPFELTDNTRAVNRAIAGVAADDGAPVVATSAMARGLRSRGYVDLAFPDMHPKPILYRAIAWDVARRLVRLNWVPGSSPSAKRDR